jgi:hypothetical protein
LVTASHEPPAFAAPVRALKASANVAGLDRIHLLGVP